MVRRTLVPLIGGLAIAAVALAMPVKAHAAWEPFFGPILNCTGYFQIDAKEQVVTLDPTTGKEKTETKDMSFRPVSDNATGGLEPCVSLCDIFVLVNNLLQFALTIIIVILVPFFLVVGGYYILVSGGSPGKRATGKSIITGTLIGLAIAVCSGLIVNEALNLLFEKTWGEEIKRQLELQAQETGVTGEIPDFQWNTLSCRVIESSIQVKNIKVPIKPKVKTSGNTSGNTNGNGNTNQTTATPQSCYSDADKAKLTCALGWIRPTGGVGCLPATPNYCKGKATTEPPTCASAASVQQGLLVCETGWKDATAAECGVRGMKICKGAPQSTRATPEECYTDAEKTRLTCELDWARPTGGVSCTASKPNFCKARAVPDSCYSAAVVQQNLYVCDGTWVDANDPFCGNTTAKKCQPSPTR